MRPTLYADDLETFFPGAEPYKEPSGVATWLRTLQRVLPLRCSMCLGERTAKRFQSDADWLAYLKSDMTDNVITQFDVVPCRECPDAQGFLYPDPPEWFEPDDDKREQNWKWGLRQVWRQMGILEED